MAFGHYEIASAHALRPFINAKQHEVYHIGLFYLSHRGLFFHLFVHLPFLSSMLISPSRQRKFGEHATKNVSCGCRTPFQRAKIRKKYDTLQTKLTLYA